MNKDRELFERTPVPRALATLAIPTIISQLITMIYNLADTFYIGLANNPSMTAASSLTFTLVFAMSCLSNLFGVGGGSLISRLLGQKRDADASQVCSFSFYGALFSSVIYSLSVLIFMEPLLRLLGATDGSIGYATDYAMWVIVVGGIPLTLSMTMANLLRSEGYAKEASFGLGMGGVINMALDPLFMFVILEPGSEVKGAAIATMLSNLIVVIFFFIIFLVIRKKSVLSVDPKLAIPKSEHIKAVFVVGIPSALSSLFACLSNVVLNNLASGYSHLYGDVPVAAVGIAKKIDMLPMNVGMGLCQGMMPLVAYNYASGNYKRMRSFATSARIAGISFAVVCVLCFQLFTEPIVTIFNGDPMTVEMSRDFLRILCLAVPLMIINFQMNFTFQAMGRGKQSLLLSSLRQGVVNIPLMFIMNHFFGLYGLVFTQIISDILTTAISFILYRGVLKELDIKQKMTENVEA
ncbi:MAG: MATE family efflux transporter [Clostridia bacterium]|nr:MATE family efflux transporter [Clostridia bacterium]